MSVTTAAMPVMLCPVLTTWPGDSYQSLGGTASPFDSMDLVWQSAPGSGTQSYLIETSTQAMKAPGSHGLLSDPGVASAELLQMAPSQGTLVADPTETSTSLYVKNLPPDFTELALYQIFSPHGAIFSCRVATDETGRCKGVGFVNFVHREAALRAMIQLQGHRIGERRHLHLALQAPKAIRKAMRTTVSLPPTGPSHMTSQPLLWPMSPATHASSATTSPPLLHTLSMPGTLTSISGDITIHST